MQNSLIQLSDELAAVVEQAGKSVVAIYAGARAPSSGVHWKPGVIVTAEHTLRRDEDIKVGLPDGAMASAELVGRDPGSDLAVLKFDAGGLPVLKQAAAAEPRTGNIVMAVGRHRDIGVCAAMGIVSVVGPGWNTWRGGRVDQFIRLDLSLYHGSSGAAIVDTRGDAIGIASAALSRIAPVAIPAVTVNRVTGELLGRGYIAHGYLGVGLLAAQSGGLIVLSVEKDSPAAKAGFIVGDILLELAGRPVKDTHDVQAFLASENIGKTLPAAILRGGARTELPVTVGEK